jgi:hypothetical protein
MPKLYLPLPKPSKAIAEKNNNAKHDFKSKDEKIDLFVNRRKQRYSSD